MNNKIFLFLTMFLLSHFVHAQRVRNVAEASQNKKAVAANEAQLERDVKELAIYKAKLTEFEKAFAVKNGPKTAAIKTELVAAMQREIKQSEKKIEQDKQELSQSKSEVTASRRESTRSRFDLRTADNDTKDARDVRDDHRDRKDDQRDAMDDQADLEQQIVRTRRQKQIYTALQAFTFSFEASLQEKAVANKALLLEFAATMEKDIAATKAEIAEDKREATEDQRERREDRRERAEKRRNKNW